MFKKKKKIHLCIICIMQLYKIVGHFNPVYRSYIIFLIRALCKIFTYYDKTQKCVWLNCYVLI